MAETALRSVEGSSTESVLYVEREHTRGKCIFICCGISMCITVDILQYSMPLAFLPSVLEDKGHEPMEIATAIGVYYWTGFLGCSMIMCFQVWRMLYQRQTNHTEATSYDQVIRQIKYLIAALMVSTVTLFTQALMPGLVVHTSCRFIQGFAGAFIFFYTALLNVALFRGTQQDIAVTIGSCALNVAEVFGSFLGAVLFNVWGQRSVFWFLGGVSIFNQFMLVGVMYAINAQEEPLLSSRPMPGYGGVARHMSRSLSGIGDAGPLRPLDQRRICGLPPTQPGSIQKLKNVFSNRPLVASVLLIAMAAVVKGSVEEMLPFHADHRWNFDPMEIGQMFCTVAIAYIISAVICCNIWERLEELQVHFSAFWLFALGVVAWCVFACVSFTRNSYALSACLLAYGTCLGLTHTPAALLAASVIDHETGAAKDAANGIFQTMWEAGGSLGFLLGGLLADRYHEQMGLLTSCAIFCLIVAIVMVIVDSMPEDGCEGGCIYVGKEKDENAEDHMTPKSRAMTRQNTV